MTRNNSPAPIVRHRTRSGIPLFGVGRRAEDMFSPSFALIDRFNVHIVLPIRFRSVDAREAWLDDVCDQTIGHPLFTANISRGRGRRGHSITLRINRGWHLTGTVELRARPDAQGAIQGTLVFDLALNFTRWLEDQTTSDPEVLAQADPDALLQRSERRRRGSTLDGADNYLSGRNRVGNPAVDSRIQNSLPLLTRYIDAIEELLTERLVLGLHSELHAQMRLAAPTITSANYAEVYHEVFTPDAVSVIEGIRAGVLRAASNPEFRHFIGARVNGGVVENAAYISVPITKTVDIVIYAKGTNVLRFEMRRRGDLREEAHHRLQRGQTAALAVTLSSLAHSLTARLHTFFAGLQMHLIDTNAAVDLFDFLDGLHRATNGNRDHARALLSQFGNFGGVTVTDDQGIAPLAVIRHLESAGYVSRVPYRHGNAARGEAARYALRAPYATLLGALVRQAHALPPVPTLPN